MLTEILRTVTVNLPLLAIQITRAAQNQSDKACRFPEHSKGLSLVIKSIIDQPETVLERMDGGVDQGTERLISQCFNEHGI